MLGLKNHYPLKQGLRLEDEDVVCTLMKILKNHYPLKQGLRRGMSAMAVFNEDS